MDNLFEKLKGTITESGLKYEVVDSKNPEIGLVLSVEIPKAKEFQTVFFYEKDEELQYILDGNFPDYRFIRGFEAIWSEKQKNIECEITSVEYMPPRYTLEMINYYLYKPKKKEIADDFSKHKKIENIDISKKDDFSISIGYCSKEFNILFRAKERRFYPFKDLREQTLTFKISNIEVHTHKKAFEFLNKISNSFLFHLESFPQLTSVLVNERVSIMEIDKLLQKRAMLTSKKSLSLKELKYEYDSDAMALFWYAKSSHSMPLFQFLAFFQVIEYYFPIYSSQKIKRKIQNIIKNPSFNPDRDEDLIKILTILSTSSYQGFGSEKEQLKASIASCFENSDLRRFFEFDEDRYSFYVNHKGKSVSKQKISLRSESADLINEVTERIYEIRCRIVHKKVEGYDLELILPYSKEVLIMKHDLELIEHIARNILIDRSRAFSLQI